MSDKKPQRPLPRFQPLANKRSIGESSKVRSIPISSSMPSFAAFKPKSKPEKKVRAPKLVDFGDVKTMGNRRGIQNVIVPEFYTPINRAEDTPLYLIEGGKDVKLPLVSPEEQTKPVSEILNSKSPKFVIVQLPSALPIKYPNDAVQMEGNPLVGATDGHLGKIQIRKSGRVTATIGNNHFEIVSGTFASCAQILCNESQTGGLEYIPLSGEKIILTLDVDTILRQIDNEPN
jgi:hypothetical protein